MGPLRPTYIPDASKSIKPDIVLVFTGYASEGGKNRGLVFD